MSNNKKIIKFAYYTMFMESEDSGISEKPCQYMTESIGNEIGGYEP
ncbi:MAG: hypothetical protein K5870_10440 [Lachnospiraceae bacterium]|nr:hypothetical protein [Lachnospiraceae bacterium]